ncbi:MAG TPA: serine/threonine-protein kinase [Pyrinomonadaceae bacterium]|nr:serine/threonine-protein kinase [Pyrinomonadaceae bacterium]
MTPERWHRLQSLFDAAVDLPPQQQAAFLEDACAGDSLLRRQAESLILAHEASTQRINEVIRDAAELTTMEEDRGLVGRRLGAYQIVQELGRGGMGHVYLAVRADDEYQMRVAIKVVQNNLLNPEIMRRFRNERQILAGLDHRYIARLLDGGTTTDGLSYVVMEYIEGEPIDRYCVNRRLSVAERLKLFGEVCAAIQYAHQNLIVHRDIKPGNILVTPDGIPKLLDFGIAKLLNPELGPQTQAVTRIATRLMTPEYASPEQIRGEAITTASDIYSLGVVLYELLTGQRPYHFQTYEPHEIERIVSLKEPAKPSTIVSSDQNEAREAKREKREAEKLRRQLAGELDAIVMMALRKEPQRRYASADQFSDDIQSHLEGRPVRARPDSIGYRAGKFVKRHKIGVGAAAVILLTIIAGGVATLWQARIAHSERARAERRFNDVRKLANSFIFDVHDNIADLPGSTQAREVLVKSALEYLNGLAQEAGDDPGLQRELALAYQRIGDVQGNPTNANLGDTAGALVSYHQALAIAEALVTSHPTDSEAQQTLALIYQKLSDLQGLTGDLNGAVESVRKSLAFFKTLAEADNANLKARQSLAIAHIKLGDILGNPLFPNVGDRAGALREYQESLALWQALQVANPSEATTRRYLGLVHERIGTMQQHEGRPAEAVASYQESLVIRESYAADYPTNTDARRDLAVGYEKIAGVLATAGDASRALENSRKSLSIFAALSAADPSNANASRSLSISYENAGDVQLRTGDASGALDNYQKSLVIRERLSSTATANMQLRRDLARGYGKIGGANAALAATAGTPPSQQIDRARQAVVWYEKSLSLWLDLRNRGLLRGEELQEPDKVSQELEKQKAGVGNMKGSR